MKPWRGTHATALDAAPKCDELAQFSLWSGSTEGRTTRNDTGRLGSLGLPILTEDSLSLVGFESHSGHNSFLESRVSIDTTNLRRLIIEIRWSGSGSRQVSLKQRRGESQTRNTGRSRAISTRGRPMKDLKARNRKVRIQASGAIPDIKARRGSVRPASENSIFERSVK